MLAASAMESPSRLNSRPILSAVAWAPDSMDSTSPSAMAGTRSMEPPTTPWSRAAPRVLSAESMGASAGIGSKVCSKRWKKLSLR